MSKQVESTDLMNVETIHILNNDFNMYGSIEKPIFLAQDIAAMIEYSEDKIGQMLENVDDDEKLTDTIYRAGQQREMWFLTENGLYELLMQSRKPMAKAFKYEIKKMLHQIRRGELKVHRSISDGRELIIENAQLLFRNFSGREEDYNREGVRNFNVVIEDSAFAQRLADDGWNVKIIKPRNEDDEPKHIVPVAVRFDNFPPKIFLKCGKVMTRLDEEDIGQLDTAEIRHVDLTINPSRWERNGDSGIKAYLKNMYVTIEQDILAAKYADDELLY